MAVIISPAAFDPYQALQDHQHAHLAQLGSVGAAAIFIGTMRDFNDGATVKGMTLDYYPGMTEKQLGLCVQQAQQQWAVIDSLIVHRVGDILPLDPIVLVAVWSAHRGDAFDACRFIMETLKSTAPFWKRERLASDELRWVEHNSKGYGAV